MGLTKHRLTQFATQLLDYDQKVSEYEESKRSDAPPMDSISAYRDFELPSDGYYPMYEYPYFCLRPIDQYHSHFHEPTPQFRMGKAIERDAEATGDPAENGTVGDTNPPAVTAW